MHADFYASQSPVSDPGKYAYLFDDLPEDIAGISKVVQGLVYHYVADKYFFGYEPPKDRLPEIDTRYLEAMLGRIVELDAYHLTKARDFDKRFVGCCRDFSLIACAILRNQGVPARLRHGFGNYFEPGYWGDHVVVEFWNGTRWHRFDPEVPHRDTFDVLDMPEFPFATGGRAWQMIRNEGADPAIFGLGSALPDVSGEWFIRQRLMQDCAALNKQEMLCWDQWKLGEVFEPFEGEDAELFDQLSALSLQPDSTALRAFFADNPRLNLSEAVTCYSPAVGPHPVTLSFA